VLEVLILKERGFHRCADIVTGYVLQPDLVTVLQGTRDGIVLSTQPWSILANLACDKNGQNDERDQEPSLQDGIDIVGIIT